MSEALARFRQAKAERERTREQFDARIARIRADIDERSVGGRIADRVSEDAKAMLDEAQHLADTHRGIIAGTFAGVALWLFRNPLLDLAGRVFHRGDQQDDRSSA